MHKPLFFRFIAAICAAAVIPPVFAAENANRSTPPFSSAGNSITYSEYRLVGGAPAAPFLAENAAPPFRRDAEYVSPTGIIEGIFSSKIGSMVVVGAIMAGAVKAAGNVKKAESRRTTPTPPGPSEPCPDDAPVRNPDTGECGPEEESCPDDAPVRNPDTGECEPEACPADMPVRDSETGECGPESCPDDMPVRDSATGECRARNTDECNETPGHVHDGGECITRSMYCRNQTPEMRLDAQDGGTGADVECRALRNEDCLEDAMKLNDAGDACISLSQAECEADPNLVYSNGACRPPTIQECSDDGMVLSGDGGRCVPVTAASCEAQNMRMENGACRELTAADCEADGFALESRLEGTATQPDGSDKKIFIFSCRRMTPAECRNAGMIVEGGECRIPAEYECTANGQIFDNERCRAGTNAAECESAGLAFENGACRAATKDECAARNQLFYNGVCRAGADAADCDSIGKFFDTDGCRNPTMAECEAEGRTLDTGNGVCTGDIVPPPVTTEADCASAGQILNDNGECQDGTTMAECEDAGLAFENGVCVASPASCARANQLLNSAGTSCTDSCGDGELLLSGRCIAPETGGNKAECSLFGLIHDNGACRAPASTAECADVNSGLVLENGRCAVPTAECLPPKIKIGNECRDRSGVLECSEIGKIYDTSTSACRDPADNNECQNINLQLVGNSCINNQELEARRAECGRANKIFDVAMDECRDPRNAEDAEEIQCILIGKIYDATTSQCRDPQNINERRCAGKFQIYDENNSRCRDPMTTTECESFRIDLRFYGNSCIGVRELESIQTECREADKFLDIAAGECRDPENADECRFMGRILSGSSCISPVERIRQCAASNQLTDLRFGTCRDGRNDTECASIGKLYDSGNNQCRAATTAADCQNPNHFSAGGFILIGDTCVQSGALDRNAARCTSEGKIYVRATDVCRDGENQAECTTVGRIYDSGSNACRRPAPGDCRAAGLFALRDGSGLCTAVANQAECERTGHIYENNACRPAADQNECTPQGGIFLRVYGDGTGICRVGNTREECGMLGQFFNSRVGLCDIPQNADDCRTTGLVFDSNNNRCRAAQTQTECTNIGLAFTGGECRAPTASECLGNGQILENDACRAARDQTECENAGLIFSGGACRAPANTVAECAADNRILDGDTCRAGTTEAECNGIGLVLASDGQSCRPPRRGECRNDIGNYGKPAYSNRYVDFAGMEAYRQANNRAWFIRRADGTMFGQIEPVASDFSETGGNLPTFMIRGGTVTLQAGDLVALAEPGAGINDISAYRRTYHRLEGRTTLLAFSTREQVPLRAANGDPAASSAHLRCISDSAVIGGARHAFKFLDENWLPTARYRDGLNKGRFPLRDEIAGGLLGGGGLGAGGFSFSGDTLQNHAHAEYHSFSPDDGRLLETDVYFGWRRADGGRTELYYYRTAASYKLSDNARLFARTTAGRSRSRIYRGARMYDAAFGAAAREWLGEDDSYHVLLESPFRAVPDAVWRLRAGAEIGDYGRRLNFGVYRDLRRESGVQISYRIRLGAAE